MLRNALKMTNMEHMWKVACNNDQDGSNISELWQSVCNNIILTSEHFIDYYIPTKALNVYHIIIIIGIQPLGRSGQRPELSQATGMALVSRILGKFLGVACHCFPRFF